MRATQRCSVSLMTWGCAVAAAGVVSTLMLFAAPADANIYFRSVSSVAPSSASSLSVGAPSNIAVGDVMIMQIDANGGTTAYSAPAGWTSVYAGINNASGAGGYSMVAYKVAASGDIGGSWTIALGVTRAAVARIADYVGVDTTTPVENTFIAGTDPNGGTCGPTLSYPAVTTTVNNSMVVFGATVFPASGTTTITPASGSTERLQTSATGSSPNITVDASDFVQAVAGAVSKSFSSSVSAVPCGAVTFALNPASSGTIQFALAPGTPNFSALTLNGHSQTLTAQMPGFAVDDTTGSGSGWNVTVQGDTTLGKSAVFRQYCPNATCGTDSGPGYITGGSTLAANSLKLDTTGASWTTTGGTGSAPAFQCSTACAMDSGSVTKIVSAAAGNGLGPWSSGGLGSTSLSLSAPTTTRAFSQAGEVYHVDLLWTLGSGP